MCMRVIVVFYSCIVRWWWFGSSEGSTALILKTRFVVSPPICMKCCLSVPDFHCDDNILPLYFVLKRILLLFVDMVNPDEDILLQINCIALR